ncbi:DUF3291 domain-containing protein [Gloeobacter kilaueensis]|uniref:DUF3291 domain-containing protein n=1 Tax=Gloeobacter kilaueensis (strain ATCC BAA-2537 / CCAP 1431/1 / ULC 316 / JS1) TaxID=1183438 RepID=U5QGK2_GLOK1|nr:DUF3291 domain-containing protein [Gloeobacter kilaueensis]AGY56759.1 hypothetical protein GKIL_0513 [Gloeobacter kilaueensis JS1]
MQSHRYHLAQFNIGRMKGSLDSPVMADFVARLDEINALADAYSGFIWRLRTEAGDATAMRPYQDDRIIVNLSVWQGLDALREYVYRSLHSEVMRRRREWFERMEASYYVLWWIPAGHIPSVAEAKERLEYLQIMGESAHAFTYSHPSPPPDHLTETDLNSLRDECPSV